MKTITYYINHINKVTATVWGWVLAAGCNVFTFFAPEKYAFTVVFVAIFLDAFFGTLASVKAKKFLLSKLGRDTFFKITAYGAALVVIFMVEKMAHEGTFIGVRVAAAWAAACEFWSMSASILILWPDAAFFKLLRRQLRGEIASKLGEDAAKIVTQEKVRTDYPDALPPETDSPHD